MTAGWGSRADELAGWWACGIAVGHFTYLSTRPICSLRPTPPQPNSPHSSMGVAVGSSIQIALFAIPFAVVVGWATGHDFSLDFSPFSAMVLAVCVIHAVSGRRWRRCQWERWGKGLS